jgi:hypothetical protein
MASTKTLEVYVDNVVKVFLDHLSDKVDQTIDLGRLMQAFAIGMFFNVQRLTTLMDDAVRVDHLSYRQHHGDQFL